jgi:hypothetical protein
MSNTIAHIFNCSKSNSLQEVMIVTHSREAVLKCGGHNFFTLFLSDLRLVEGKVDSSKW